MKIGILMDPPHSLIHYKDSTVAIIHRALDMGWSCHYFTQKDLFCLNNQVLASVYGVKKSHDRKIMWGEVSSGNQINLTEFNVVLMRKDPPFNLSYIYTTYALELAAKQGVIVSNNPQSLRDVNEKCIILTFPDCITETIVTNNLSMLRDFWSQHKPIVIKPLDSMGGQSIFEINSEGDNLNPIIELLTQNGQLPIMAQKYIPEIKTSGDKRILFIDGEALPAALARIPAPHGTGNLVRGAIGKVVELTKRDHYIAKQVGPFLKQKGLHFVGVDVIGDYLTEINVTSPTCIREIELETGLDISGRYLSSLAKYYSST